MARRSISNARVLVTGASSGIGRAVALEVARQGARVVVAARREPRLVEVVDQIRAAGGQAAYVCGDVTDPQARQQMLAAPQAEFGGLDVLVNNAGIGAIGPFAEASAERLRRVMDVNFFAPVELIRAALPQLAAGQRPLIVNVGSVLGHRAVPGKSEYCASKFALHGFSDALRAELAPRGIDVLLVSPSTTASEFFDNVIERHGERPPSLGEMPAAAVARAVVRAMRRGNHEVILSAGGKLLVWADRLCPPLANRLMARLG